jgi:hypothetical protein
MRLQPTSFTRAAITIAAGMAIPIAPVRASSEPQDPSSYPEMSREQTLPVIAKALRNFLLDAGSVTNFTVCYPPVKVKFKDARRVRWTVMFSLNARNSYGGYTGTQQLAAIFYADKPVHIFNSGMAPTVQYGTCTHVPDAEIRQLIEAE